MTHNRLLRRLLSAQTALIALVAVGYLPYFLGGGSFMIDDWQVRVTAFFQADIWKTFTFWNVEGGSGMRPLASALFAVTPFLFGESPLGYVLLNVACWAASIAALYPVMRHYGGERCALWAAALACVPTIASSTIFEPIVMIIGSASALFWALSLWNIHVYMQSGARRRLWLAYALVVVGLLIYEVSAPLLLITALLPLAPTLAPYLSNQSPAAQKISLLRALRSRSVLSELARYGAPVAGIIIVLSLFQKFIVPLYGVSQSRLTARPLGDMARSFGRWLFSVVADTPVMLASSFGHYGWSLLARWDWWLLLLAIGLFVVALRKTERESGTNIARNTEYADGERRYFLLIVTLTLFACSALSVFSGFNMRIEGIENRFLGSTWILLSILCGALFARLQRSPVGVIAPILFTVATYWSFMIQSHNYTENRRLQADVVQDCLQRIRALPEPLKEGAFIIGNVPIYANRNFNNEVVFAYRFDFGGQLKMRLNSETLIDEGQVINVNRQAPTNDTTRFFLSRDRDTVMTGNLTGLMKRPLHNNVWWYEFDQYTRQAQLLRIRDTLHFDSILAAARAGAVNMSPLPVAEQFRNSLKERLGRKTSVQ
jgi:hypothetical protein